MKMEWSFILGKAMRGLLPAWHIYGLVRAKPTGALARRALEVPSAFAIGTPTTACAATGRAGNVANTSLLVLVAVRRQSRCRKGDHADGNGDGNKNYAFHGIILHIRLCETSRTDCTKNLARGDIGI